LPVINLALALALSAVVVLLVGENPLRALRLLAAGAFGSGEAIGYTLYYATSFAFTGLAVAVAFHASLFNIGAEGQAYLGGLGVGPLLPRGRRLADGAGHPGGRSPRRPCSAPRGRSCRRGSRPGAAATSSSRRSCSISSPRR
jgi:simple sugar transport system permease protein